MYRSEIVSNPLLCCVCSLPLQFGTCSDFAGEKSNRSGALTPDPPGAGDIIPLSPVPAHLFVVGHCPDLQVQIKLLQQHGSLVRQHAQQAAPAGADADQPHAHSLYNKQDKKGESSVWYINTV